MLFTQIQEQWDWKNYMYYVYLCICMIVYIYKLWVYSIWLYTVVPYIMVFLKIIPNLLYCKDHCTECQMTWNLTLVLTLTVILAAFELRFPLVRWGCEHSCPLYSPGVVGMIHCVSVYIILESHVWKVSNDSEDGVPYILHF